MEKDFVTVTIYLEITDREQFSETGFTEDLVEALGQMAKAHPIRDDRMQVELAITRCEDTAS